MYSLSSTTDRRRAPRVIPGQSPYVRVLQGTPQHPSPYVFSAASRAAFAKLAADPPAAPRPSTGGQSVGEWEETRDGSVVSTHKIASGDFASWRDYHRAVLHLNELGAVVQGRCRLTQRDAVDAPDPPSLPDSHPPPSMRASSRSSSRMSRGRGEGGSRMVGCYAWQGDRCSTKGMLNDTKGSVGGWERSTQACGNNTTQLRYVCT
eukprot:Hpha_TRINITY_DN7685_c0_g2::TRINITY_DN7685_c0_g2_i1::g.19349::m.19349